MDYDLIRACEERIVNAWPAVDTLMIDGFVVRFANGYSGRANSASALHCGARFAAGVLDLIEGLYRKAGLDPCIRCTPLCDVSVMEEITERGYTLRDRSIGMVADLDVEIACIYPLELTVEANANWVRAVSARQSGSKKDADDALHAIVSRIRLPATFATLKFEGADIGFGMTVVERGMAEIGAIIIDETLRGRGFGKALVAGLMNWARRQGARQAYLQVDESNGPAIKLYTALGFREVYRYSTMEKR